MPHKTTKLPASVKVATHTYNIEATDKAVMDDIGIYGDLNTDLRRIRIADELPEANHALDVVLHEIIHACYRAYHIEGEREEEYTVTNLATALAGVFKDNPELRKWIDKVCR